MTGLRRFSALVLTGLAAAGAMVIGSFGPWAKAIGLINVSVGGTDGSNDGWFVVLAAFVGAGALILYARGRRAWALGAVLAGIGGAAATIYDRGTVTDLESANTSELVRFNVGWGLNLAMGASIVLGIVGLVALLGSQYAPGMMSVLEAQPTPPVANAATEPRSGPSASTVQDIQELAALHERGVLSDDEFRLAKERLLAPEDPD